MFIEPEEMYQCKNKTQKTQKLSNMGNLEGSVSVEVGKLITEIFLKINTQPGQKCIEYITHDFTENNTRVALVRLPMDAKPRDSLGLWGSSVKESSHWSESHHCSCF